MIPSYNQFPKINGKRSGTAKTEVRAMDNPAHAGCVQPESVLLESVFGSHPLERYLSIRVCNDDFSRHCMM